MRTTEDRSRCQIGRRPRRACSATPHAFAQLGQLAGRRWSAVAGILMLCLLAAGCAMPGDAAPVVKIGVIAPFEGAGRSLGYAVLPAIKTAAETANRSAALGRYRVAVVALDDSLDPATAARQAASLAQDPDILAVIGPFTEAAASAVRPVLVEAAIPCLPVISATPTSGDHTVEIAAAKEAASAVLQALAADIAADGLPDRLDLAASLALH